jgi:Skp family chaperone for outer membrane proteins
VRVVRAVRAWIGGVVIGCVLGPWVGAQTPAPRGKTVYLSSQRVFAAAPGWAQAEAEFTRVVDSVHTVEQRMDDSMATLLTALGRDEGSLTPEARTARRQAIERQHVAFGQRRDQLETQVQVRRGVILDPITARVRTMLARIRTAKGYGVVLDMDSGAIIAADSTLDVTDAVIAELKTIATK